MADPGAPTTNENLRRAQDRLVSLVLTQPFTNESSPLLTTVPSPPAPAVVQEPSPFTQADFPSPFSYLPQTESVYKSQPTIGTAIPDWPTDYQLANANQASKIPLHLDMTSFSEPLSSSDLLAITAPIVNLESVPGRTSVNPSVNPSISAGRVSLTDSHRNDFTCVLANHIFLMDTFFVVVCRTSSHAKPYSRVCRVLSRVRRRKCKL